MPQPQPYYAPAYFQREYFKFHPGKRRYCEAVARLLRRWIPLQGARVLDVGCGHGFLLKTLGGHGCQPFGIEMSEAAADKARSLTGATISVQSAEASFPFAQAFFQAVIINDVIEHLHDYAACLKESYRVLESAGVLFVQTLSAHSIARALLGRRWSWHKDPTHVRMFSPPQLRRALEQAGFQVVALKTFFNLCQVGETTRWLRPLRPIGRLVPFPWIGDSVYTLGRKPSRPS